MTDIPQTAEQLLDFQGVASTLNLHPDYVRRLASKGLLPHIKIGRRVLFRPSSIQAFITEHEQKPVKVEA